MHPKDMPDEEYDRWIRNLPSAEDRIAAILRESRYVMGWFPPYSSGAGDLIEELLAELKEEWSKTDGV